MHFQKQTRFNFVRNAQNQKQHWKRYVRTLIWFLFFLFLFFLFLNRLFNKNRDMHCHLAGFYPDQTNQTCDSLHSFNLAVNFIPHMFRLNTARSIFLNSIFFLFSIFYSEMAAALLDSVLANVYFYLEQKWSNTFFHRKLNNAQAKHSIRIHTTNMQRINLGTDFLSNSLEIGPEWESERERENKQLLFWFVIMVNDFIINSKNCFLAPKTAAKDFDPIFQHPVCSICLWVSYTWCYQ